MEPLAAVTRNGYIESVHYGFACVVDSNRKIIYSLGDYNTSIFFRSSAKPIQAIPFLQSGAAKAFDFSLDEIAISCASHSGQKIHQQAVSRILDKLELDELSLHCGTMAPYNEEENKRIAAQGKTPSVLHCSCSGKHSAMLALSKFRGYSLEDYERKDHPVQQEILKVIAEFADEDANSIPSGVDGCGVPIYILPINKIALSYAKLMEQAQNQNGAYHDSCKTVVDAMIQYPEMVAGDYEFCTELMKAADGKLIGKVGCEAVYCIGIKKGSLGICVKIIDGTERAVYPVVIELLKELGVLNDAELSKLKHWHRYPLKNNLDEQIGEIAPIFNMKKLLNSKQLLGRRLSELE